MSRPDHSPIALTAGEPAGIGPDLCIEAALLPRNYSLVCLGDRTLFEVRAAQLQRPLAFEDYRPGAAVTREAGRLCLLHQALAAPCTPGTLDPRNARQVLQLIERAADGCRSGEFSGMVTAPVQKSVINDAGIAFTGHTEFLANWLGAPLPVMMLVAGELRVALATTHLPLRAVSEAINVELLLQILTIIDRDLRQHWQIASPHVAVCGLNPHAGESGYLGDEEQRVIEPALREAQRRGLRVSGPHPADTLFVPRNLVGVDAVLAMYHDQGLPVLKHAGFGDAVNVTLGLPIIRTSVDHGTALALAGTGRAEAGSLLAAIALAARLAGTRP